MISCSSRLVEARTSSSTSWTYAGSASGPWSNTSVTEVVIAATGLFSSCEVAASSARRKASVRRYTSASRSVRSSRSACRTSATWSANVRSTRDSARDSGGRSPTSTSVPTDSSPTRSGNCTAPVASATSIGSSGSRRYAITYPRRSAARASVGVTTSGRSGASARSRLRSKSRRTSASRASAAAARSRANPTSAEITIDIDRKASSAATYSDRSRENVP